MNRIKYQLFIFFVAILLHNSFSVAWAIDKQIIVPVQFGDLQEISVYYGEIQASETTNIHAPEMSGEYLLTVKEVADDGVGVKKGDIILRFEDGEFCKGLVSAENELEVANAELEKTKFELKNRLVDLDLDIKRKELELEKAKVMVVEGSVIISKIELKKSKLAVKFAELELEQAKNARKDFQKEYQVAHEIKELKVNEARQKIQKEKEKIKKAVIIAPCDGVIFKPFVRLNNEMGRVEKNKVVSPGDKLLELPSLNGFRGIIYINPSDNRFMKIGDQVKLYLTAFPENYINGVIGEKDLYPMTQNERLGRKDPEGELEENKVLIDILDSSTNLRPGMTFRCEITTTIASQCLYIPRIAIQGETATDSWVLISTTSKEPLKKAIKTGQIGISYIEVIEGLKKGEMVILPSEPAIQEDESPE